MRITELFTAQSIALDEALTDQEQIISHLVELQATHGNITDKDAYKKALYAREAEGSTYVDNGITVPHAQDQCSHPAQSGGAAAEQPCAVQCRGRRYHRPAVCHCGSGKRQPACGHAGPYDARC